MPQFIHLTDQKCLAMIRRNGIKAQALRGGGRGLYAAPVTPNHFLSHQWLRELRRRGMRTISAVRFWLADEAEVRVGRYNEEHMCVPAAEAVRIFLGHKTGLGLEIILPESITAKNIRHIYTPRQISGWRYYPEAHADGRRPCGCSYCQRGEIRNRKLRQQYEADFS